MRIGRENEWEWRTVAGFCDETQFEILNETVPEGRVTWHKIGAQSAVDCVLTNARATERECAICVLMKMVDLTLIQTIICCMSCMKVD